MFQGFTDSLCTVITHHGVTDIDCAETSRISPVTAPGTQPSRRAGKQC